MTSRISLGFARPLVSFVVSFGVLMPPTMAPAASVAINDFSRDKVVFDVGAAFGRAQANVPVSGTADPDAQVQVRVVNDATGDASAWRDAGTTGADGTWTGEVAIGADADWYRVEARVADAPQVNARTDNRFGGGDVVAYMGQSELERITSSFLDRTTGPSVTRPDQVQLTYRQGTRGPVEHTFVNDSEGPTAATQALAQFWIDNAPEGRKVHFVDLAQSGTSHFELADDSRTDRSFADLEEMTRSVRADGGDIGVVLESWFAADAAVGTSWDDAFSGFYTGLDPDGDAVATGAEMTRGRGAKVDNFMWDLSVADRGLFDEDGTKLGIFGPHRFESPTQDPQSDATTTVDGNTAFYLRNIERSRRGIQEFLATDPVSTISVDKALPVPLDYANGFIDEDGEWVDQSHPSGTRPDGVQRFAKHMGNAALLALGHVSYETPKFDRVRWTEDYVEIGSTGGRITTARIERGLPPLGDTFDHWTDVLGIEIDGTPAHRAEITPDGFVRIFAPEGEVFDTDTLIEYGNGGATGFLEPFEDFVAEAYLNIPIVDVGLTGLEGVAVMPTSAEYAIPNTLGEAPAAIPLPASGLLLPVGLLALRLWRGKSRARPG